MEVASLVLGIIGTITGLGALGWQVITWRRSGPVVKVSANQGYPTHGDRVSDDPVTIVTARNIGRAPVTVTSCGLRFPDGQAMFALERLPGSDQFPYRLEEGASGSWWMNTRVVAETSREHGVDYRDLRAFVNLASGQGVAARKKGIQLGPGFPWPSTSQ